MFITEEQTLMANIAREFAQKEVAPRAKEIDQTGEFPYDLIKRAGELGLMGMTVPEEYGGVGADLTTACLVVEEIAKESPVVAIVIVFIMQLAALNMNYGKMNKKKILVPAAKGEK